MLCNLFNGVPQRVLIAYKEATASNLHAQIHNKDYF